MNHVTRQRPWLCTGCGYLANAVSPFASHAKLQEGSLTVCLNCGMPSTLDQGSWRPLTPADWQQLTEEEATELRSAIRAQAELTKRGRHA